jgi:YVTN family beta-propeller protein
VSYSLGVDLGTTFVAAAVAQSSRVEMFTLGDRSVVAPAVVYLREDGSLVTGDAASRRAVSNPDRVGREFKRRLGDPTPVMLGGAPYAVTSLLASLLSDVVAKVEATQGAAPDSIVLTHPANWGPYRRELFEEVPQLAGLALPRMVTEPEAAAAHYAASRSLSDGEIVAVYDLGGGTFDATVLRKAAEGIEILGTPEGIERLGGVDFDEAVLAHVNYTAGGALSELDMGDAQTAVALARLRQDCILAKEALSIDTETTIPVFLPSRHFDVRLTRADFEDMVRAPVESTIGALTRTLRSAEVRAPDLSAVLLVGGSSRIPLVARMIAEELGAPTVVDAHPKYAVALGAARLAAGLTEAYPPAAVSAAAGPQAHAAAPVAAAPTGAGPQNGVAPNGLYQPAAMQAASDASATTTLPPRRPDTRYAAGPPPTYQGPPPQSPPQGPPPQGPPPQGPSSAQGGPSTGPLPAWQESLYRTGPPNGGPPDDGPPSGTAGGPLSAADGSRPRRKGPLLAALIGVLVLVLGGVGWFAYDRLSGSGADTGAVVASPNGADPGSGLPAQEPAPAKAKIATAVPIPTVGQTIPAGQTPGFVAISPNGRLAYVANRAAGVVTVIDTAVDKVTATIPVQAGPPQYLAFAPDGKHVYVSIFNDQSTINVVGVLDTTSNSIVSTIPVGTRPFALAVTPDGSRLYVPNHDSGTVSVIDTATSKVTTDIKVAPNPHWAAISNDGTRVYTANHESGVVTIIDTSNNSVVGEVKVQVSPHSLAVAPSKPLVANVNYDSDSLTVIDTTTEKVIATVPVGRKPQDVAWSADGRFVYVTAVEGDTVTVINTDTWTTTATVPTGDAPTSVAVLPDGSRAFVTNLNSGTISVLHLAG